MNPLSLWQKLTGNVNLEDEEREEEEETEEGGVFEEDAELNIDLYQTPNEIIVQTMVPGVRPEDLQIEISRDTLTIRGKREGNRAITDDNYYIRELYWGSFSRTIQLPEEVDIDEAEAVEKHGLLILKLPKVDKQRKSNVRVKSV